MHQISTLPRAGALAAKAAHVISFQGLVGSWPYLVALVLAKPGAEAKLRTAVPE